MVTSTSSSRFPFLSLLRASSLSSIFSSLLFSISIASIAVISYVPSTILFDTSHFPFSSIVFASGPLQKGETMASHNFVLFLRSKIFSIDSSSVTRTCASMFFVCGVGTSNSVSSPRVCFFKYLLCLS